MRFKSYRYFKQNPFYDPERVAYRNANLRRATSAADLYRPVPRARLSRDVRKFLVETDLLVNRESNRFSQRSLIAAALSNIKSKDFADPAVRQRYRALRRVQLDLERQRLGQVGKTSVAGADKRRYDPTGKDYAVTRHGVVAKLVLPATSWVRVFRNPLVTVPCVQRSMRREVMFARRKAGKGYRSPKRKTWASGVPC